MDNHEPIITPEWIEWAIREDACAHAVFDAIDLLGRPYSALPWHYRNWIIRRIPPGYLPVLWRHEMDRGVQTTILTRVHNMAFDWFWRMTAAHLRDLDVLHKKTVKFMDKFQNGDADMGTIYEEENLWKMN